MKTKLEDVLPFYAWSEVQTNEGLGILVAVAAQGHTLQDGCAEHIILKDGDSECIEWYKLILRPLESITEEESEYICPAALEGKATIFVNAEMTAYLLKCGFDLFDLHSQGLCLYRDEKGGLY